MVVCCGNKKVVYVHEKNVDLSMINTARVVWDNATAFGTRDVATSRISIPKLSAKSALRRRRPHVGLCFKFSVIIIIKDIYKAQVCD